MSDFIKIAAARATGAVLGGFVNRGLARVNNTIEPSSVVGFGGRRSGGRVLTYPFDVGDGSSNNHFITFSIKEFKPAKVSAARKKLKDAQANLANTQEAISKFDFGDDKSQGDIVDAIAGIATAQDNLRIANDAAATEFGGSVNTNSIALRNSQTSKVIKTIALYMPPSVNATYGASYADSEIGALADIGSQVIESFFASQGDMTTRLGTVIDEVRGGVKASLEKATLGALNTIAPGARALAQATTGTVVAPRMELMFERVNRRNFSYNFILIPKSVEEARIIEEIVQEFKLAMHPEFVDATQSFRRMKMPNLIDITFHSHGGHNNFINKISTCYLKSVNVTYGGDRYTAHEPTVGINGRGSPPQRTTIALEFSELGILSKEDIRNGF
jgi:hypothetical protein